MGKFLDFLKSKVAQIICWIVLFISAGILIYNGITTEQIGNGIALFLGIITAISAVVIFIKKMLK